MSICRLVFLNIGDSVTLRFWNTHLLLETPAGHLLQYPLRNCRLQGGGF